VGDYLAIVTLGFGQVFVQLAKTATRVNVPFRDRPVDFTRGPNGINGLDNISIFGFEFDSTIEYYFLFLVLVVALYIAVDNVNRSRTGRAWRAIREDELAAEVMGTPTRRMKLLAFAIGAGIAALAGAVDAAWQGNVVPEPRYSVVTLINLYAMVVLGGIGSLPGVVIGAFIFTVLPEALRSAALAGILFYTGGLIGLYVYLKPFKKFAIFLGSTIIIGFLARLLVNLIAPSLDSGFLEPGSVLNSIVQSWLIIPPNYELVGNVVTVLVVFTLLAMVLVKNPMLKNILLGLSIYMFAFSWETRLAVEPASTRILIVGATLVVLMIFRPQGLLGKAEVRVV
jgi:ABC-type branched-subunit amino acid transport system permease subunit